MAFVEGPFQNIRSVPDSDPTTGPGRYFYIMWRRRAFGTYPSGESPYEVTLGSERHRTWPYKPLGSYGAPSAINAQVLGIGGFGVLFCSNGIGGHMLTVVNRDLDILTQINGLVPGEMIQLSYMRFCLRQPDGIYFYQIEVDNKDREKLKRIVFIRKISSIDVEIDGVIESVSVNNAAISWAPNSGLYIIKYAKTTISDVEEPDYSGPYGWAQEIIDAYYPPPPGENETNWHVFAVLNSGFGVQSSSAIRGLPSRSSGRIDSTSKAFFWHYNGQVWKIIQGSSLEPISPFGAADLTAGSILGEFKGGLYSLGSVDQWAGEQNPSIKRLPSIIVRSPDNLDLINYYTMPEDTGGYSVAIIDSNSEIRIIVNKNSSGLYPFETPGHEREFVISDDRLMMVMSNPIPSYLSNRYGGIYYAGGSVPWRVPLVGLDEEVE